MSGDEVSSAKGLPRRGKGGAFLAFGFALGVGVAAVLAWVFWGTLNPSQFGWQSSPSAVHGATIDPLKGAAGIHGKVLSADGTPVSGASVFVALPGPSNLRIRNGRIFFENYGSSNFARASTSADGKYILPAQSGKFVVAAIADQGYGQLDQDAAATNADIKLTAWGRIQGRLMIGNKPGVGVKLQAWSMEQANGDGPVRISMANFAETDADGDFELERVVPGTIEIDRDFVQISGGDSMEFEAPIGSVEVGKGETATVHLGGVGRPVVGKFIFPAGMRPSDYFLNARAFSMSGDGAVPIAYFLQVDGQNHFRIDDVPAGDYRIHIFLQKVRGERTEPRVQPRFSVPAGSAGAGDEPVVIPDISLQ